jgi:hypothetical protein
VHTDYPEQRVDDSITGIEHPTPDERHRHTRNDDGQKEQTAQQVYALPFPVQKQSQSEAQCRAGRHRPQGIVGGVDERAPEGGSPLRLILPNPRMGG